MHEVLVNRLGGLSLPRKSVVRLTDRPDMTLDVYRGRKTTMQQQQLPYYEIFGANASHIFSPKIVSVYQVLTFEILTKRLLTTSLVWNKLALVGVLCVVSFCTCMYCIRHNYCSLRFSLAPLKDAMLAVRVRILQECRNLLKYKPGFTAHSFSTFPSFRNDRNASSTVTVLLLHMTGIFTGISGTSGKNGGGG